MCAWEIVCWVLLAGLFTPLRKWDRCRKEADEEKEKEDEEREKFLLSEQVSNQAS